MKNKNSYIYNFEQEINISPESSQHFDEMYNNPDILSYSESKSQSLLASKNINNNYIINNKDQSLKNILINPEETKEANNNNIDKELSSLQISLSNLLSDKDSKEIIFNKKSNNKIIDISYDISNYDNDKESETNNNQNNKVKKIQNDEQSSLCNYAKSLYKKNVICTSPKKKKEYKIEKGEDINISLPKNNINNKTKRIFLNNDTMDFDNYYRNHNLSINKVQNFTINNIVEFNQNYNLTEENYITSIRQPKLGIAKNKIKLINNKNIDINKDDSNKFFYNPKNKNENKIQKVNKKQIYKTIEYSGANKKISINKKISNAIKNKTDFKKNNIVFKKLLIQNKNSSKNKINNSNNSNNSFIKKKKLFYLNRNDSKNYEKNISFNNFNKTEISINKNNILSNVLLNKIKTEQKRTTRKILNRINNMNNLNRTNNRINFLPIFNKIFDKKIKNKKPEKQINNNQKENKLIENQAEDKIKKIENKKIINNNNDKKDKNKKFHEKIKSQINIVSLLNNFNKEKNEVKKKNKSIYNFGNIFFINQNQYQVHKKNDTEINIKNNINIRNKLEIINNFSNYRKKSKFNDSTIINKTKRFNTEIDLTGIKNKLNYKLNKS